MAPYRWLDEGRLLTVIFFVLAAATLCVCDEETECFYELRTIGQITYLGSFDCEYGCCGTTENQRCCTKEERYKDYDRGIAWRIAGIVVVCILAVVLIALAVACIMKKKNKKKMTVYDVQSHSSRNGFSSFAGQPTGSGTLPSTLSPSAPIASTTNSLPPSYTFLSPGIREKNTISAGIATPERIASPPPPYNE